MKTKKSQNPPENAPGGSNNTNSKKRPFFDSIAVLFNPLTPTEQAQIDLEIENGIADGLGKWFWPLKRLTNFLGYKATIKTIVLLIELPFVIGTALYIYSVFQTGAQSCVLYKPLITSAEQCLSLNPPGNQTIYYIPQTNCRKVYANGQPEYNFSKILIGLPNYEYLTQAQITKVQ